MEQEICSDTKLDISRLIFLLSGNNSCDVDDSKNYYCISLLSEGDSTYYLTQTHWAGFTDESNKIEIREGSLVRPEVMIRLWTINSQNFIVVNSDIDFILYKMYVGGHALVEESIARKLASNIISPSASVMDGAFGFRSLSSFSNNVLNYAPTPKQRMRIFKRDGMRCKICGRSPHNYTDVEIHIHHIKKFSRLGLTIDNNLISLCNTCHKGLDPHEDLGLFDFIKSRDTKYLMFSNSENYDESVRNYRYLMEEAIKRSVEKPARRKPKKM